MNQAFHFAHLLTWLAPLLGPLWLWGLSRVLRDMRRASPHRPYATRSGLRRGSLGPLTLGVRRPLPGIGARPA
jgi:hypothetical protein